MPTGDENCDVAVIGAGPAGLSAARLLAQAGLKVFILEKAKLPRYKTCGGGILARAVRLINDSPAPIAEQICNTVQFSLAPNLQFTATRPQPIIFMTMREAFDQWLTRKATGAGAMLRENHTVRDAVNENDRVRLITNQGEIRARYVVAADGAGSAIVRLAGWPAHRRLAPAVECEVTVAPEEFTALGKSVRFDFDVIDQGYGWVFPKKSHLSIGVLSLDPRVNLNRAFNGYLNHLGISHPISIERHGYIIPLTPRSHTLARGRILLTGDAAGLADPVTAEGITAAIQSGRLAAETIGKYFSIPRRVCEGYDAALQEKILPELRHARRLAALLYKTPRLRNALFRRHGQRLAEVMTDIVMGNASYVALVQNPVNYAKLLFSK